MYPGPAWLGGAGRDRTGDLLNANQALSQLSYSPLSGEKKEISRPIGRAAFLTGRKRHKVNVGTISVEIRMRERLLVKEALVFGGERLPLTLPPLPADFSDSPHGLS